MKTIVSVVFLLVSTFAFSQIEVPEIGTLDSGWNSLASEGVCSTGTPYNFFVKPSPTNDQVLIFFNGGGACWFGESCDLASQPNVHFPFSDMDENNPELAGGIFDFSGPDNPFHDFTIVFLPYCTGDVHLGAGPRSYSYTNKENQNVTITAYHNGFANSSEVLAWVYSNIPDPERLVVAGSSAGAVGASFYSGLIAENYSDTPVVLLADAAGGYGTPLLSRTHSAWDTQSILPAWNEYKGKTNQNLTFEDYYIASANHNNNLTIAQYNGAEDITQVQFTLLIGDPIGSFSLPQRILNNYQRIESEVKQFYSYTAGGDVHMILPNQNFYDYEVEGVRFVDWVTNLIAGEPVGDVSCVREVSGCSTAPDSFQ